MSDKPIYVTQPHLPALAEFIPYLEEIWSSRVLTNSGPMHQELERRLASYLDVERVALFNNGTIALLTALQSLRISGEVITTPYSFVATAHSLLWNGIKPVFVDIDPESLNLDPAKIEEAITPATTAILPVHCYGNPCDTAAIRQIADNYNLRVIYDAAHAFAVEDASGSVLRHGDLSVLSFHATKVFHTFEGGAIVCPDERAYQHIRRLKNFGFVDEVTVSSCGINGKMSEICAAMGLLQLEHIDSLIARRAEIDAKYRALLRDVQGITCIPATAGIRRNHAYFPVLVGEAFGLGRDELYERLRQRSIFCRRYFYPLISSFPMYRSLDSARPENLPIANEIAGKIICLPMYPALTDGDVDRIAGAIAELAVPA